MGASGSRHIRADDRGGAMILSTRYSGDQEVRLFETTSNLPPRGTISGSLGQPAIMNAAVAAAVKLIRESIGGFVARVYEGTGSERQPITTWQSELFQYPSPDTTSFEFWSDISASLELYEFALILKRKGKDQIVELEVVPPEYAAVDRGPDGRRRIRVNIDKETRDVTNDVIYIRAWSPNGAGPIATTALHSRQLQTANQFEQFRGAYFQHGGQPGVIIQHPGQPTEKQKVEILDSWIARTGDASNAHKPGLIWGGAEVTTLPASMQDSQGAQTAVQIVQDVARMFRIYPAELLHTSLAGGGAGVGPQWADLFARFTLFPRMRKIERALSSDADLFPQRRMYLRFDASDFTKANVDTLAVVAHQLVQVGILSANEGRAMMGFAKADDPAADQLQATPVGGAVNEASPSEGDEEDGD